MLKRLTENFANTEIVNVLKLNIFQETLFKFNKQILTNTQKMYHEFAFDGEGIRPELSVCNSHHLS